MSRIGFLVNPIAGMGGRVGLKGTDGVVGRARELGARPAANLKARRTLHALRESLDGAAGRIEAHWLTCSGRMGADCLADAKSHYAAGQIAKLNGVELGPEARGRSFFKEFVVELPRPVDEVNRILLDEFDIMGGYDLGRDYPHLDRHMLIAVTEMNTRADIDRLVEGLRQATR